MAKNIARGQNIIAKNIIPNLVGMTRATAQDLLTSLGFTYTATSVNTTDANQNDKIISQGVTASNTEILGTNIPIQYNTFSFAPFGAFGFTPAPFNFTPEPPAFSFTPFGAFTFVTFGFAPPFGFSTFGFTPFGAFGFLGGVSTETQPACIWEDSLIMVKRDNDIYLLPINAVSIGDIVYSISGDNFNESDFNGKIYSWESSHIDNPSLVESTVTAVYEFNHKTLIYFNEEVEGKMSLEEPVLIKRNGKYEFITAGMVEVADIVLKYSKDEGRFIETVIGKIDAEDGDFTTYNLITEPQNMLLVNGLVVHNK